LKLQIALTITMLMVADRASAATGSDNPFKGLDCKKATVQMELNECANREFESWDGKLNTAYRAIFKDADPKGQVLLKAAEKSWISYRDNECAYETSSSEGGSIQPMEYSNCLTAKTRARIAELKSQGN
jgi:uncharacterized protein YecT (DUF1311 family)